MLSVFYMKAPVPGHKFRQISLHELDTFIVIVGEGEVIHDVPKFQAESPDAEAAIFDNLAAALKEVDNECRRAEQEGWIPLPAGLVLTLEKNIYVYCPCTVKSDIVEFYALYELLESITYALSIHR